MAVYNVKKVASFSFIYLVINVLIIMLNRFDVSMSSLFFIVFFKWNKCFCTEI